MPSTIFPRSRPGSCLRMTSCKDCSGVHRAACRNGLVTVGCEETEYCAMFLERIVAGGPGRLGARPRPSRPWRRGRSRGPARAAGGPGPGLSGGSPGGAAAASLSSGLPPPAMRPRAGQPDSMINAPSGPGAHRGRAMIVHGALCYLELTKP